jgi:hypothetical protein
MFFLDYMRGKPGTRYSDHNTFDHRLEKAFVRPFLLARPLLSLSPDLIRTLTVYISLSPSSHTLVHPRFGATDVDAEYPLTSTHTSHTNNSKESDHLSQSPYSPRARNAYAPDRSAAELGGGGSEVARGREREGMLSPFAAGGEGRGGRQERPGRDSVLEMGENRAEVEARGCA